MKNRLNIKKKNKKKDGQTEKKNNKNCLKDKIDKISRRRKVSRGEVKKKIVGSRNCP